MKPIHTFSYSLLILLLSLLVTSHAWAWQEASLTNNTVVENQKAGTVIGAFMPATASFSLTSGVQDNVPFVINGQTLATVVPLNFENQSSYSVLVDIVFTDQNGLDSIAPSQPFTITVLDTNDPPIITSQTVLSTPRNAPLALQLSDVAVSDEDVDDSYPTGFTLQVGAGENYTASGQVITPVTDFSGTLTVPVTVNDGENDSAPFMLSVTVEEVVAVPSFTLAQSVYAVDEDFAIPERVIAELEDPNQEVVYQIIPEEVDFATLTADNSNGIFTFSPLPDRNGEENFTIKATNEQNNFFERVFTFRVNPVNDAPTFAGVAENDQRAPAGSAPVTISNFATAIAPGPVTAVDESTQTLTFNLIPSDPSLFIQRPVIDPAGTLTYQPVDNNIGTSQVQVALLDNGGAIAPNQNTSVLQSFTIEVFAPEEPQDFELEGKEIAENLPAGTTVGTFDKNSKYTITGGANQDLFAINDRSLVTRQPFNFEDPNQRTLEVQVERAYGLFDFLKETKSFSITVLNVEEPPTDLTLTGTTVAEGSPAGTPVGTLGTVGGAPEVTATFAFVPGLGGEDNGRFSVTGNQLSINEVPDFETKSLYNIRLQAVGDGTSPPRNFVIQVTNTAEPPTNIILTGTTVSENEPVGTTVGTLSVEGGATTAVAYSLSGADAGAFSISGNTLVTSTVLDAETKATYAFTITATGDGTVAQDFTITVANVVEPPTAINLDNNTVAEGAPVGTTVGTLSATGGEAATDFALVPGEGSVDNGSFSIEGSTLSTSQIFDFETKNSYTIRVRATGDGSFEQVLTITVTDQPDPPNDIQLSSQSVRENQPATTVIGTLAASGGEGPYTFSLAGNQEDNAGFAIAGNELRSARPFNFEVTPTLTVVIRASNADGNYDQPFTITIVNEEEPPTNIALSSSSIRENAPAETVVGTLSATGGGNEIVYTLVGGEGSADNSQFQIVNNELRSRVPFNFEAKSAYTVRIRASGDGSYEQALPISIVNEAEPPTEILLSSSSVQENAPIGTVIGTLSTVGGSGNFTFSLVGNNQSFQIEGNQLITTVVFDREARPSPDYPIRVRASGDGSLVSAFTITILNVDEAPVLSEIEGTFLEFAEGQAATIITETLRIADPDSEQLASATVSFSNNTYVSGEDELILTATGIGSEWSPSSGRLVIRGPLSRAQMQSALRSVQYRNLSTVNPTASTRRVSFQVNDGTTSSNQQERFIRVSDSNIPPVLTDIVVSTPEDNAADITRDNFANAYGGDEDGSGFSETVFIITLPTHGVLSVGNRVLTDSDISPPGFEVNLTDNPVVVYTPEENYSGTDSFQWTAVDRENESGIPANVTISILPKNDSPVISAPATVNIEENTEDPLTDITINDPDNDSLFIRLLVDQGALTVAEDIRSEVAFVTGTGQNDAEVAFGGYSSSINDVLANVFYLADDGSTTLTITVTDIPDDGNDPLTAEATVTLTVIPQNDNPVLISIEPDTLLFAENSAPLLITNTLRVTDEENDDIVAAVVTIDSGYSLADSLLFDNTGAITGTLADGTLTLTGTASVEAYQEALRSVTYFNSSDQPEVAPRTIRFEVTDATGGRSNTQVRVVSVVAVEDTLQVVDIEPDPAFYVIGSDPVVVSRTVRLYDPDSETMDRLTISFSPETYVVSDDSLGIAVGGEITSTWDASRGILTLSGLATLNVYEQAIRSLTYSNRNGAIDESSRQIRIQGFSGETSSNVAVREIRLINNTPPVITDLSVVVLLGTPYTFTDSVFQEHYTDEDNSPSTDGLVLVQITSLPSNGTLFLNETPITQNDIRQGVFISAVDVEQLVYVSNQGYLGEDQFTWNASDGAEFAEASAQVSITVADLQVTLGDAIEKCLNADSVQLEATITGGAAPYLYNWSSDHEESIPKNSSIVSVLPTETTNYTVAVTDAEGITVTGRVQVRIIDCPDQELAIPSAFTPDGDGVNDVWEINNILTYENNIVEIYDRYGHRLFRSEGYSQPWDGRYQGKELPVGTYYYTITLNDGVAHYKGAVTILK